MRIERCEHRVLPGIAAILAPLLLVSCVETRGQDDYLDAGLRQQVERLKDEIRAEPTTEATIYSRAPVLWDWMNAYALAGGTVPVNLSLDLHLIRFTEVDGDTSWMPPGIDWRWSDVLRGFDRYVEELRLKDEEPGAVGSFRLTSPEPVTSRQWTTIELTYTVGTRGLHPGAAFLLGSQTMSDHGRLQVADPAADGWVSVRASRPGVTFEPTTAPLAGMHGGFFSYRDMPVYRVGGTGLRAGDTVVFTLGDTSRGSRGFQVQSLASDAMLFPFYVDLDGSGNFLTPAWASVEVVGAGLAKLALFAPSVVGTGEAFQLAVRAEDDLGNRAEGRLPPVEVRLFGTTDGVDVRRWSLGGGGDAVQTVDGIEIAAPGTYRFRALAREGDTTLEAWSNPIWVEAAPRRRVLWGETHGHTAYAEGQGTPAAYFRYGAEDARLDFLTLSEHDVWLDAGEWRTLQELSRRYTESGVLAAFLGYEWSAFRSRGGHHNVLFRKPGAELVALHEADRLPLLYQGLRDRNAADDVLVIPHAHRAGDWTMNDPDLEKMVEIYSLHGSFEWFGNRYLQNGFEVGFVGASDDHRAKPGYTIGTNRGALSQRAGLAAAVAPDDSPDAIFDALRSLSAYATSGQRILVDADLNGHPMGTRQPSSEKRELSARVSGTSPVDRIDVVRNGEVVFSRHYLTAPLRSRVDVLVTFESSSEVFGNVVDNPRPYRFWQGSVEVEGARIAGIDPVGFDNPYVDRAELDSADPQRVLFVSDTRGRGDTLLLRLEGATASTALRFRLESTTERGFAPGLRQARNLPAEDFRLVLGDMTDGRIERVFPVPPHTDRIGLQLVDAAAPMDRSLVYADLEDARDGDYYYVRVTQLDGGRAWTSPWWVGRRETDDQEDRRDGSL